MNFRELEKGMTVRIAVWSSRPKHWNRDMDGWQGEIITISGFAASREYVYIEEDDGEWQWYPWDFEPYHPMSKDNPNLLYARYKQAKLFESIQTRAKGLSKKKRKG